MYSSTKWNKIKQTEIQHNKEPNPGRAYYIFVPKKNFFFFRTRAFMRYNFVRFVSELFLSFFFSVLVFVFKVALLQSLVCCAFVGFEFTQRKKLFLFTQMLHAYSHMCICNAHFLRQTFSLFIIIVYHYYFVCIFTFIVDLVALFMRAVWRTKLQQLMHALHCIHTRTHRFVCFFRLGLCSNHRWKC